MVGFREGDRGRRGMGGGFLGMFFAKEGVEGKECR